MPDIQIGVDIGGTFTDVFVREGNGSVRVAKIPSSRKDPSAPMRTVLSETLPQWNISPSTVQRLVHGTTVATNAVLERRGAKLGLITTYGFADVLEIGRQNRSQLYDLILRPETPVFLAPGHLRKGVVEAVNPDGTIRVPLDEQSLAKAVESLIGEGVQAIAICFLFSFLNDTHERRAASFIREQHPKLPLSLSCDLDPAFREYERTVVTAFDAYVKPVLDSYLHDMEGRMTAAAVPAPLQIMHSRGGINGSRTARERPIRLFLSGPAGGVIGGRAVSGEIGIDNVITLDVGGTSSDIALVTKGQPVVRSEGYLDGHKIRVPMVDVNAIGAGGGSIAWIDRGGGLRVGPHSAGAEPGPAAYHRGGEEATVTDASVVLGYLDPQYFAGGTLSLHPDLALAAIERKVAKPLGLTVEEAALGIHRVVTAQMADGIRLVSISRGVDPRDYALIAFGGGGPIHGIPLARELGIKTVVVPRYPGLLSAMGLLAAPVEHESSVGWLKTFANATGAAVLEVCTKLVRDCEARMQQEATAGGSIERLYFADVCYVGQAYHLEIQLDPSNPDKLIERCYDEFVRLHEQINGHATRSPARFVNLRAVCRASFPDRALGAEPSKRKKIQTQRVVRMPGSAKAETATVYQREALAAGDIIRGPAVIEQTDTTTLIESDWVGRIHASGAILLTKGD